MLFRLHRDPAGGAVTRGRRVARAARLAASHQYLYRRNRRRRGTVGAAFEYRPASAYQHRATGTWSTKATSASRGRRHVPGPRCSAGVSRAAPTGGALGATSRTFPFAAERWRYQAGAVVERGRRPELSGRGVGRKIGAALGGAGRWVGVVVAANVAGFAAAVGVRAPHTAPCVLSFRRGSRGCAGRGRCRLGKRTPVEEAKAPHVPERGGRSVAGCLGMEHRVAAARSATSPGDGEMDARMDRVYARSRPALHCPRRAAGSPPHGLGFYAHQYPQSAAAPPQPDLRPALHGTPTPALVIKGSCDYLSWSAAEDYLDVLPNSVLVYLRGAGHNAYQDRPAAVMTAVRAFLHERTPPEGVYRGTGPPAGFRGPRGE